MKRRTRRAPRKLSRAQRLAKAPRFPSSVALLYRIALARVAAMFVASVRRAVRGKLGKFALARRADAASTAEDLRLAGIDVPERAVMNASSGVIERVVRHSKAEFKRVGIPKVTKEPAVTRLAAKWRKASAERVVGILEHEKQTILELLQNSENRTPEELQDRLEERYVVTKSKLEGAAHDDVLTLNGQITQQRQTAAGIEEFIWTTAGDGDRVRESHQAVDGNKYRWDDPPVIDDHVVVPGEPPNCRCVAYPKLPELEE